MVIWLVVGPTPLKNMKVKWEGLFHIWNGTIIQMFQTTNQVNSNEISIWIVTYCDIFWHIVTYCDPFPWTIRRVYSNFTQTHVGKPHASQTPRIYVPPNEEVFEILEGRDSKLANGKDQPITARSIFRNGDVKSSIWWMCNWDIKIYRQQNHFGLSRNGGRTKHRSENDDHWWILRGPQFPAIPHWKVSMKWWIYPQHLSV